MANTRFNINQTKGQVVKKPVVVVTTSNISLSAAPSTYDGVTLVAKDRILVAGQTTASQNGIYTVTTVGTGANGVWTRSVDASSDVDLFSGNKIYVSKGTLNEKSDWTLTTSNPIVVGTTALTFEKIATGGEGTVSSVSITSANGLAGSVLNSTTTPSITLSTTVNGIMKGNGTSISAAVAGTDYLLPTGSAALLTSFPTFNQNTTGTSANVTGIVAGANGGTGVANTGKTITLGADLTTIGAFDISFTASAITALTLPTSGTLSTLAGTEALTNKNLTGVGNIFPTFNQNTTGSAASLATGRTIGITGDVTYTSPSFNGTANVTATATISNSAVIGKVLTGLTLLDAPIVATDSILTALGKAQGQIDAFGAGAGAVSNVSVVTANGFAGTVANATTTPAITLTTSVTGLIKGNGTALSAAVAGTDYLTPTGSAAGLTSFPTFNQSTTGSAATLTTARTIGMTGDVTWTSPAFNGGGNVTAAATVTRINGVALSGLGTGLLKNTTTTGVPSIAVAGTDYLLPTGSAAGLTGFPTFNQNTTGTASNVTGIVAVANGGTGVNTLTGIVVGNGTSDMTAAVGTASQLLRRNALNTAYEFFTPTYLSSYTETDPVVKAINGIVKSNGTTISAAVAGTDYLTPTGSAAGLTAFPTFNQNTTGSAASLTTGRTIGITGEVVWTSPSFNGTANVTAAATITNAAVVGKVLTGLVITNSDILATDTILVALGKAQGQINSLSGTVTSVSVASANGFAGTVATSTTTPAITISTTVTGLLKGNGTALSAAVAGTDYLLPTGSAAALTGFPTFNQSTTGSAATLTTGRTIAMTGDVSWTSPAFNGSANVTAAATISNAAVIGKVLTGLVLTNSDILATDTIVVALGKAQGQINALSGTVTSVSVTAANGFTGSVATATTTPAISIGTSITGMLKGNGTAILAATAGTDYALPNANTTGSAGTLATGRTIGMTGDVTWTSAAFNGSANVTGTATIANGAVTYAKMQDMSANNKILGRHTGLTGAGDMVENTVGIGLIFDASGLRVNMAQTVVGDTVVQRNAAGYIYASYFNMNGAVEGSNPVEFIGTNGTDGFLRRHTIAQAKAALGITGAGEANTASNVGTGGAIYKQKTGVNLEFKTVLATVGSGIATTQLANELSVKNSGYEYYHGVTATTATATIASVYTIPLTDNTLGTVEYDLVGMKASTNEHYSMKRIVRYKKIAGVLTLNNAVDLMAPNPSGSFASATVTQSVNGANLQLSATTGVTELVYWKLVMKISYVLNSF